MLTFRRNVKLVDYDLNGSIIKIRYSFQYEYDDRNYDFDNSLEVELLDYITFVFNSVSS